MGNSASSQKYHPDAVGPTSPPWAPQSRFNQHKSNGSESTASSSSSPIIRAVNSINNDCNTHSPAPSPVTRIPVPLYNEEDLSRPTLRDSRKSFSGPIRNRPSNPSTSNSASARSRSTTNPLPSTSNSPSTSPNHNHQSIGIFDPLDPAGLVPPFIPSKVSTEPKQPPIIEMEDESKSILEPSDHGHSPHTLPLPLAEALKHGLGKSADDLDREYREQQEEAATRAQQDRDQAAEMIQEEGNWMNQKGRRTGSGETDKERLLAYWEQNEAEGGGGSTGRGLQSSSTSNQTPDLTPHVRPGIRRPRPHSWNSNQRPTSSLTVMSFATGDSNNSGNNGWSSEWQDTRGGTTNSRPVSTSSSSRDGTLSLTPTPGYSSAYSYGAELSTPMEEEEEWQTPAERPDMDRFSFSQDGEDQAGDSDTEVDGERFTPQPQTRSSSTPEQQISGLPQSDLLVPPPHTQQQSRIPSIPFDSGRKHSKASLYSAAAPSSTADPELAAEQEDSRSSHDRRRRSLLAGLGEGLNLDKDQDMDDRPVENSMQDEEREQEDRMEVEEVVGLALEGPQPEGSNLQWPNQSDFRDSLPAMEPRSNSLRSSRISNRTNMSSESNALHAAVETLRKGPSPMIDRRAIDELFEGETSRDTMEGIESENRDERSQSAQNRSPTSPVKRNRAASLIDRLRGRNRKGSEASNVNPMSTPSSSNSQIWNHLTSSSNSPPTFTPDQVQSTPRSVSSGSFFNSRIGRPRAHSAAQPINRTSLSPIGKDPAVSSSNTPSRERRESDAMAVDQDGLSEGISDTTAKPQRTPSLTRRALLRRKLSNPRMKKTATTYVGSGSAPVSAILPSSSNARGLAHKRSATGSISNASPRSHSARSVRSKRSSSASLRSAYKRENPNLSDSSVGPGKTKRTPSKTEDQNGFLKVSPPSLSLRRKGSPMPIRNSYLSEQRRPLPLPASATNSLSTSSINHIESEQKTNPSEKVRPKLPRIGLGRRNSESTNAEPGGGVWEDVETPEASKKSMEGSSSMDASPLLSPNSNVRRWSGGWSWSKKSPSTPLVELPPPAINDVSEIRSVSPLAHIESHGMGSSQSPSNQRSQNSRLTPGASSSYKSPSSSFSSLAPPPAPALPPPPRKSNRKRTDSSSASLVETTSSAQHSPSEASFTNLALSSRKGSLPDTLASQEQKRFSDGSNSAGNRNSGASSSSSPHDGAASLSSPVTEASPSLNSIVSGLAAFGPPSSAAPSTRTSLDEAFRENHPQTHQESQRSRGDSETVSDAGTKEILLSENDEDLIRAQKSLEFEIEAQAFPQVMTPKASPSQSRRSRNGSSIPPPALSPVKEASIHKAPSFASENLKDRPSLPQNISPSSSTVDLKKIARTVVGPAPNSPLSPVSSASRIYNDNNSSSSNNKFNPNSLMAQKSSSSFQKHAGEDLSHSSSSPSNSLRQLLSMHPQSRVRKPSQAESDVSLMSVNGRVLDSISLASAPTNSAGTGRRIGSQHSHSRSLSGGTNVGGAEDRLSNLLVENQNAAESSAAASGSYETEYHSLPRTPRRPLPAIPDQAPVQTRGSRSFSLPSGKAPAVPTSAELRSWSQMEEDGAEGENATSRSNQKKAAAALQPHRSEQHRTLTNLINSAKPHGSSLASELGLQGSKNRDQRQRQRTFSAPTSTVMTSRSQDRELNQEQDENKDPAPVPFADSGVQASLAALAALEARGGDGEEEDPRAAWARERILGYKDGTTSIMSRLSILNDNEASRRSASEEISGSEIELRGSRDRRRASPYSKSRRSRGDGNRSSDGGYSSSARGESRRKTQSAFSNSPSGFLQYHHPKDFTGMATASSASLAEFEASQQESEGTSAVRTKRSRQGNSRSIPPSFLLSPPLLSSKQEPMQIDSADNHQSPPQPPAVNDWDEMVVPALRKRIEQEKQFELEQMQISNKNQINSDPFNHRTSSSNLSSQVSPTLVSTSFYNPLSSSGFMGSSVDSRTTGVPFPRESFSNSSYKSSKLLPDEADRMERVGRKSFDQIHSNRNQDDLRDEYVQESSRRRRKSEAARGHTHHQSSPKQSRPKTSERRQTTDDKYGSLSSTFRSPSSFPKNHHHHSPNQSFSHLSSNSRHLSPGHRHHQQNSSPRRSVSHEVSSGQTKSPPTTSINMSVRTGNGGSSSRRGAKKPSKQGFSGEDILAWQSSISSGFIG